MRVLLCVSVLIGIALAAPADINVTGNWSGTVNIARPDGSTSDNTVVLILKQSGTEISGTVGTRQDDQRPIQKGKIDGDKIALEVQDSENNRVITFALVLAGDRIKGDVNITGNGETRKATLDVVRK
jgi:hypothetical protein